MRSDLSIMLCRYYLACHVTNTPRKPNLLHKIFEEMRGNMRKHYLKSPPTRPQSLPCLPETELTKLTNRNRA